MTVHGKARGENPLRFPKDLGNPNHRFPHSLSPATTATLNSNQTQKEPSPVRLPFAPSGSSFDWKRLRQEIAPANGKTRLNRIEMEQQGHFGRIGFPETGTFPARSRLNLCGAGRGSIEVRIRARHAHLVLRSGTYE